MTITTPDRRQAARLLPSPGDGLSRVRLRTGRELLVVNISSGGALLEGPALPPGAQVDLLLPIISRRLPVRSRVVRSVVHRLAPALVYRVALTFERPMDVDVLRAPRAAQ